MNYRETVKLPETEFPAKAGLKVLEPKLQEQWASQDIYGRIREARKGATPFIMHDGPPYVTGDIHIGTGMNKVLKDILVKYKTMQGFDAPYIPGFDCHGLPVERKVLDKLGKKAPTTSPAEIREQCDKFARTFIDSNTRDFKSLAVFGRWDEPYLTLNPKYEAGVLDVFCKLVEKGFLYRKRKPIHWCMKDKTALAQAELIYKDRTDPQITVRFNLTSTGEQDLSVEGENGTAIVIWTTTPWTLCANVAAAVHPDFTYGVYTYEKDGKAGTGIWAKDRCEKVVELAGLTNVKETKTLKGSEMEGWTYQHPFLDRKGKVVLATYVTLEDGTGCVHTAPGHGADDYETGLKYDLEVLSPVNAGGVFTDEAGPFKGQFVFKANKQITAHLEESGNLLHTDNYPHSYPHCWRCHEAVIFRATPQWFVQVDHADLRKKALDATHNTIQWFPTHGENRMSAMLTDRPDWVLSRQRFWGIPIPAFLCNGCNETWTTPDVAGKVRDFVREHGATAWFKNSPSEILGGETPCPECGSTDLETGNDIFDVWFESGASWRSVLVEEEELSFPADIYLEGHDQYRGWFQVSLLLALGATGEPPFKTVITHGFVVDDKGEKMSKSLGNFISVADGVKDFGGDIVRLLFSSVDYTSEVGVSRDLLKRTQGVYRKIRNTLRFMFGNLADFDPSKHGEKPTYELAEVDRWALARLENLLEEVGDDYESYRISRVYRRVYDFCVIDMSNLYLDIVRDRLYCGNPDDPLRRGAQNVLFRVLTVLLRIMAPILPHTTEEAWEYLRKFDAPVDMPDSIHLASWPDSIDTHKDSGLLDRWERLLALREDVLRVVEDMRPAERMSAEARREKGLIANALEARITLHPQNGTYSDIFDALSPEDLSTFLVASEVVVTDAEPEGAAAGQKEPKLLIKVEPAPYEKCDRCWRHVVEVGTREDHPALCNRCAEVVAGAPNG